MAQSTTFGLQQVITNAADGPIFVYATDLDGDGDADVLSASYNDDKIAWYENSSVNAGNAYCFGDGTGLACPCTNGDPGAGCSNSVGTSARLEGSGSANTAADSFTLSVTGAPPVAFGLFVQGDVQANALFGNGIRCLDIQRRGPIVITDGAGAATRTGLAADVVSGQTRQYQFIYRDLVLDPSGAPVPDSCGGLFNYSNGWTVTWF